MIDYKYPTIASGATPIGSTGRAPDDIFSWIMKQRRRKKILKSSLLPPGGSLYQSRLNNPKIFRIETVKQGCDIWFLSASSWQNSNAMIEIYHKGKTPGSVLCGLVYAKPREFKNEVKQRNQVRGSCLRPYNGHSFWNKSNLLKKYLRKLALPNDSLV
jgi:hypothetical protein